LRRPKIRGYLACEPNSGSGDPRQSQRKTGPLCSSDLHKGPVWSFGGKTSAGLLRSGNPPYRPETWTKRAKSLLRPIYFFFLAVFFFAVFFAFFAFLAMLPSQKVGSTNLCSRESACTTLRLHHNRKIETVLLKPMPIRDGLSLSSALTHPRNAAFPIDAGCPLIWPRLAVAHCEAAIAQPGLDAAIVQAWPAFEMFE
jgi:hypothetical protein